MLPCPCSCHLSSGRPSRRFLFIEPGAAIKHVDLPWQRVSGSCVARELPQLVFLTLNCNITFIPSQRYLWLIRKIPKLVTNLQSCIAFLKGKKHEMLACANPLRMVWCPFLITFYQLCHKLPRLWYIPSEAGRIKRFDCSNTFFSPFQPDSENRIRFFKKKKFSCFHIYFSKDISVKYQPIFIPKILK